MTKRPRSKGSVVGGTEHQAVAWIIAAPRPFPPKVERQLVEHGTAVSHRSVPVVEEPELAEQIVELPRSGRPILPLLLENARGRVRKFLQKRRRSGVMVCG